MSNILNRLDEQKKHLIKVWKITGVCFQYKNDFLFVVQDHPDNIAGTMPAQEWFGSIRAAQW